MVPGEMIRNNELVLKRVIGIECALDPAIEDSRNYDRKKYRNDISLFC